MDTLLRILGNVDRSHVIRPGGEFMVSEGVGAAVCAVSVCEEVTVEQCSVMPLQDQRTRRNATAEVAANILSSGSPG